LDGAQQTLKIGADSLLGPKIAIITCGTKQGSVPPPVGLLPHGLETSPASRAELQKRKKRARFARPFFRPTPAVRLVVVVFSENPDGASIKLMNKDMAITLRIRRLIGKRSAVVELFDDDQVIVSHHEADRWIGPRGASERSESSVLFLSWSPCPPEGRATHYQISDDQILGCSDVTGSRSGYDLEPFQNMLNF
jgi:hypothetical protein